MRVIDQERVKRYKKAFPNDIRSDQIILKELNEVSKEKRYINIWINRQVYEGQLTEQKLSE